MAGNTPGIGRIILLLVLVLVLLLRVRALEVWFFSPTGRWSVATGARSFLSRFVPGQVSAAVAATAGGIDALLRSAFFAVLLLLLSSGGPTGMSVLLLFRFLTLFCFCVFNPASATFQHLIYRYAFACQLCSCWRCKLRLLFSKNNLPATCYGIHYQIFVSDAFVLIREPIVVMPMKKKLHPLSSPAALGRSILLCNSLRIDYQYC
jgi:hypothetical protein